MENPESSQHSQQAFFDLCLEGIEVMNSAANHILRFNYKCGTLGQPSGAEEVEALADLAIVIKQACQIVRQKHGELFVRTRFDPSLKYVFERFEEASEFVDGLVHKSTFSA